EEEAVVEEERKVKVVGATGITQSTLLSTLSLHLLTHSLRTHNRTLPLLWFLNYTSRRPGWISFCGGMVAASAFMAAGIIELGPWVRRTMMSGVGGEENSIVGGREEVDVEEQAVEHCLF